MTHRTTMQNRGRLHVPIAVQREADIHPGDILHIKVLEPGVILMETLDVILDRIADTAPEN